MVKEQWVDFLDLIIERGGTSQIKMADDSIYSIVVVKKAPAALSPPDQPKPAETTDAK